MTTSREARSLRMLLNYLTVFRVLRWGQSSQTPVDAGDRVAVDVNEGHVVSSLISKGKLKGRHLVVLDIDHPAWLVKSSTEGHYHLYIDVKGGIEWEHYSALLAYLAVCGVIEPGYANASIERGHSDVRLPWIKKEPAKPQVRPVPGSLRYQCVKCPYQTDVRVEMKNHSAMSGHMSWKDLADKKAPPSPSGTTAELIEQANLVIKEGQRLQHG